MVDSTQGLEFVRQYLMFNLGGETYGVGIHAIREIIEYPGVTTIPLAPAFLHGVINLRGAVVPVLDLSVRFGREPTVINRRTCIVVVEVAQGEALHMLGVLVDAVSDILTVDKTDIHPVPEGNSEDAELLNGIVTHDNKMVGLIDLHAVVKGGRLDG